MIISYQKHFNDFQDFYNIKVDLLHSLMRTTGLYYTVENRSQILSENIPCMFIDTLKCTNTTIILRVEIHSGKPFAIIKLQSEHQQELQEFKRLFEKFFENVEV